MAPNRVKRSNIWLHFKEESEGNGANCNYCAMVLSIKNGSLGNLNRHMKNKHPTISLCVQRQPLLEVTPMEDHTEPTVSLANSAQVPSTSIQRYFRKPLSAQKSEKMDEQLVKMICKGHHSLRIVEEPAFRTLIEMVSNCPGYQLPARKTLTQTLIPKIYAELIKKTQEKLSEAVAVCLGTDAWTSNTNQSYIAVTAHFINSQTQLCSILLGCITYSDRHTSQNLRYFLKQIMNEWKISDKITCVVSDNAANILAAIKLEWKSISCFAHSLNLVVQTALSEIDDCIRKVKAIVEFFKKSSAGLLKLQATQKQMGLPLLKLKKECPTRWNSCYDMLDRILKIKDAIISTVAILRSDLTMLPREWDIIERVVPILKPLFQITTEISSEQSVTLSKAIVYVQLISKHLSKCSSTQCEISEIDNFIEKLRRSLQTRFGKLEEDSFYTDSTILDPRFKRKGFHKEESFNDALCSLRQTLGNTISADSSNVLPIDIANAEMVILDADPDNIWNEFDTDISTVTIPQNPVAIVNQELTKYLNEAYISRQEDPLKWWHNRKNLYPHLYQHMLYRLCIQATSVSCERVFSSAGQILNQRRTLLKHNKVSELLFLHSNL